MLLYLFLFYFFMLYLFLCSYVRLCVCVGCVCVCVRVCALLFYSCVRTQDMKKWVAEQNSSNINCRQSGMQVRIVFANRASFEKRVRVCVNVAAKS